MDLTIGSFRARFESSEESPLLGALRKLRRLADLAPPGEVVEPMDDWFIWYAAEEAVSEAGPCPA